MPTSMVGDSVQALSCPNKEVEDTQNVPTGESMDEYSTRDNIYRNTWFPSGEHQDWYYDENIWMCQSWMMNRYPPRNRWLPLEWPF